MMRSTLFVKRVRGSGYQNPFVPGETVIGPEDYPCGVIVTEQSEDVTELCHIRSITKGVGAGSKGLETLKAMADETGVTLVGNVGGSHFTQNGGLNIKQLTQWYRRHGFIVDKSGKLKYVPKTL